MLIIYEKTIATDVIKLVNFDSEGKNTAQKLVMIMNQSMYNGRKKKWHLKGSEVKKEAEKTQKEN